MSELAGILAFVVLFILFCALPPRGQDDGCAACGARESEDEALCSGCPLATGKPAAMEEPR